MNKLWMVTLLVLAGCNGTNSHALIAGDSITLGYTPYVQTQIQGVDHNGACSYPQDLEGLKADNAGNSERMAACMDTWMQSDNYDVVYFNAGLHDARNCGSGPEVILSDYLENLQKILDVIRLHHAKPIFASTTQVQSAIAKCLSNDDVLRYNSAAVALMNSQGVAVDDLYSVSLENQSLHNSSGIHFTPQGYEVLGEHIAHFLAESPN